MVVPWIARENILLIFLVYRWRTSEELGGAVFAEKFFSLIAGTGTCITAK
jgi:hypothetical protein